jgi:hypothetical protein
MIFAIKHTDSSAKFVCASQPVVQRSPEAQRRESVNKVKNLPL